MAAYMVVLAEVKDRAAFIERYAKPTAALIARFGGEYLVRAPKIAPLEGAVSPTASAVISKWPDRTAIERFWNSPDYAPLKAVRQTLAMVGQSAGAPARMKPATSIGR
mgnify:CR=1 FL=1